MGRLDGPPENPQNITNPGANNSDIPIQFPPPAPAPAPVPVQFPPPAPEPVGPPIESPYKPLVPIVMNESWKTELFDCMDDPTNAIITCCFPCITFGQIAEILDNGQTPCATSGIVYTFMSWFIVLQCIYSSTYRFKLRNKFNLVEAPAPDWITHFLFEPCALCQAYRELQKRGIDPTIGWIGDEAILQQQRRAAMNPPSHQTMN